MKTTISQIRKIIKEEIARVLQEALPPLTYEDVPSDEETWEEEELCRTCDGAGCWGCEGTGTGGKGKTEADKDLTAAQWEDNPRYDDK